MGVPVPRAASCREHPPREHHDRRARRHWDRGHLRPGRGRGHDRLLLDLARREGPVRAQRPDPGVRPERAARTHALHRRPSVTASRSRERTWRSSRTSASGSRPPVRPRRRRSASASAGTSWRRARPIAPSSDSRSYCPTVKTARRPGRPRRSACASIASRSLESTLARMRDFLDAPGWTEWTEPSVPTTGLRKVLSFTASLHPLSTTSDQVIVVPTRLPRGWYLVEIGRAGAKAQAFLQVTEVSAWVTVLSDRTVVWVNDVARGRAIRSATVRVAGGPSIGRTGSNGLLVAETPVDLVPSATESSAVPQSAPPVPILIVRAPERPRPPRPVRHRPERRHLSRRVVEGRSGPEQRLVVAPLDRPGRLPARRPSRGVGLPPSSASTAGYRPR